MGPGMRRKGGEDRRLEVRGAQPLLAFATFGRKVELGRRPGPPGPRFCYFWPKSRTVA